MASFYAEHGGYCPEQPLYFYQLALNKSPGSRQRRSVKWQGGGDYLLCSDFFKEKVFLGERKRGLREGWLNSFLRELCGKWDFPLQQHVRSWNIMRYIYSRKGDCIELLY